MTQCVPGSGLRAGRRIAARRGHKVRAENLSFFQLLDEKPTSLLRAHKLLLNLVEYLGNDSNHVRRRESSGRLPGARNVIATSLSAARSLSTIRRFSGNPMAWRTAFSGG